MTPISVDRASGTPLRIGVLGAGGQLGSSLVSEIAASKGAELAFSTTRADLDLEKLEGLDAWLDDRLDRPGGWPLDVVINAAAQTAVDACESEAQLAYQVNALAPGTWAKTLAQRDVGFVHVSTDYVFAGDEDRPYREEDATDPRSVYGKSKRAGEIAVLGTHGSAVVVRTSWVFGPGRNFVVAILEQAEARRRGEAVGPLTVVDDQKGSPTSARDLAAALLEVCALSESGSTTDSAPVPQSAETAEAGSGVPRGLLHLRNAGETTWFGFARKILDLAGYADIEIEPISTSTLGLAAPRPEFSTLDCSRAADLGIALRPWPDALASYLRELGQPGAASIESVRDPSVSGGHR